MSDMDFVDDDLVKLGDGPKTGAPSTEPLNPPQKDGEVQLRKMGRQRKSMENQLAAAEGELERLRQRQEDKKREKEELSDILVKGEEYEAAKKDLLHKLQESLIGLEHEEVRTAQLTGLFSDTRKRFTQMLADIQDIDETSWPDAEFHEELANAQLLLDSVRVEISKALAKIEALERDEAGLSGNAPVGLARVGAAPAEALGFGHWLKVGVAISISLLFTLVGSGLLIYWLIHNLL